MIKGKYLKVYIVFVGSSDRQQPSGTQRHLVADNDDDNAIPVSVPGPSGESRRADADRDSSLITVDSDDDEDLDDPGLRASSTPIHVPRLPVGHCGEVCEEVLWSSK